MIFFKNRTEVEQCLVGLIFGQNLTIFRVCTWAFQARLAKTLDKNGNFKAFWFFW